jgi:hypothetical protein
MSIFGPSSFITSCCGSLESAGVSRFAAHYLHGIHHILLLVVVRVAKRGRPGKILVHISQNRGNAVSALTLGSQGCWSTACPEPDPSNRDGPAPIGRPRQPDRETWTPRESAPPANLDRARSARPAAATAPESAAHRGRLCALRRRGLRICILILSRHAYRHGGE